MSTNNKPLWEHLQTFMSKKISACDVDNAEMAIQHKPTERAYRESSHISAARTHHLYQYMCIL